MNRPSPEPIEQRLARAARAFPYPETPSLADAVRYSHRPRRGLLAPRRLALAVVAIVLAALLAVPEVRAGIRSWIIGVIEVIPNAPAASAIPASMPAATPPAPSPTATTPAPRAEAAVLRGLAGPTSLEDARRRFPLPIRLPLYPADLGPPDRVYVQDLDGSATILVWLEPADPSHVRLSLHLLTSPAFGSKTNVSPENVRETSVDGQRALWIDAPHLLEVFDAGRRDFVLRRLVEGKVLIWQQDNVTYRLESDLALEEAVRVAESLE